MATTPKVIQSFSKRAVNGNSIVFKFEDGSQVEQQRGGHEFFSVPSKRNYDGSARLVLLNKTKCAKRVEQMREAIRQFKAA